MSSDTTDLAIPLGTEEQNLKLASEVAAVTLLTAEYKIAQLLKDPTLTLNQTLAIGEHAYKVSGMAKKQEPTEQMAKVVVNFLLGEQKVSFSQTQTEPIDVTPTPYTLAREAAEINFAEAPEFR